MALIGGIAFILIQLWLLVYFARSLGNIVNCRIADGGNRFCWYGGEQYFFKNKFTIFKVINNKKYLYSFNSLHSDVLHNHSSWSNCPVEILHLMGKLYDEQIIYRHQRRFVPSNICIVCIDMLQTK